MGCDGSVDSGGGNWNECIIEFWVSCRAINWASETFSNIHHSRHHRLLLLVVPFARKHKPEDGNRTRGRGGAAGGSSSEQADRSRYSVNCSVVELWVDEILSDWFKIEAIRFITLNTSEALRNCWCWDGQAGPSEEQQCYSAFPCASTDYIIISFLGHCLRGNAKESRNFIRQSE